MIPGIASSQGKFVDLPTAVSASAGNAQATVSFTLPVYDGKGVATYVATSSPSGLTGSGASSPITVTGLANGTSYTFTVTTISGYGVNKNSVVSNSIIPVDSGTSTTTTTAAPTTTTTTTAAPTTTTTTTAAPTTTTTTTAAPTTTTTTTAAPTTTTTTTAAPTTTTTTTAAPTTTTAAPTTTTTTTTTTAAPTTTTTTTTTTAAPPFFPFFPPFFPFFPPDFPFFPPDFPFFPPGCTSCTASLFFSESQIECFGPNLASVTTYYWNDPLCQPPGCSPCTCNASDKVLNFYYGCWTDCGGPFNTTTFDGTQVC